MTNITYTREEAVREGLVDFDEGVRIENQCEMSCYEEATEDYDGVAMCDYHYEKQF